MKRHIEVLEDGITDSSGVLLASGTVKFFIGGTTTLKTVFKDFDLTIPHPNPLTLDAAGRVTAFHDGRTKLVISDSAAALVRTVDNVGTEDSDVAAAAIALVDGDGLIRVPGTTQLNVNVDNSTINIVSDKIQLKDDGVTGDKLNDNTVDDSTIEIASNKLQVKDLGITRPKQAVVGEQVSASSGTGYSNTTSTFTDVTNLSVTITTSGRPVVVKLIPEPVAAESFIQITRVAAATSGQVTIFRDAVELGRHEFETTTGSGSNSTLQVPVSSVNTEDIVVAGTYTYKVQARVLSATSSETIRVTRARLLVREL